MLEFLRLLGGTVTLRPYVFTFLAVYLFLAITIMGRRRTLLFTAVAYILAFLCEYSSIHNGFPFGLYYYIPETRGQELWIAGVPFMDSLSFTFLSFVSFQTAILLRSPLTIKKWDVQIVTSESVRSSWMTTLLAGLLMMYLDIIIDPVALQGEKWFLGKIYYYPNGGVYFGVPISNFLGWFFTCVVIIRAYLLLEQLIKERSGIWHYPFKGLGAVGLYFGVLGFNLTMTFLIGETMMGWVSAFLGLLLLLLILNHISYCAVMEKTTKTQRAQSF
jgi:uncharacterized membrane protein